jgi:hypothetical protein
LQKTRKRGREAPENERDKKGSSNHLELIFDLFVGRLGIACALSNSIEP